MVHSNPLDRETAFNTQHHKDFASRDVQEALATSLQAIQHTYTDHCMLVGGDYRRGGPTTHYIINYHPGMKSNGAYEVRTAGETSTGRIFETLGGVYEYMNCNWRETSFTYVGMVATSQTAFYFNKPEETDRTLYESYKSVKQTYMYEPTDDQRIIGA